MASMQERFEALYMKASCGCWPWLGAEANKGYGSFRGPDGKTVGAHAMSYRLYCGPVPAGLELDHLCRNPACVNPAHLEPVTRSENFRRGRFLDAVRATRAARTHCKRGHPFAGNNLWICNKGARQCRTCRSMRKRQYRLGARNA